jgi:hypothetical protein
MLYGIRYETIVNEENQFELKIGMPVIDEIVRVRKNIERKGFSTLKANDVNEIIESNVNGFKILT